MSLLEDLKKPFNIITLVIAIIAIGISVFLYYKGKKEMELSYQITEPTSLIFDSKKTSSNIKLLEKDSIPITDNVYLLTGIFWNSGDLPISKANIRIPLSFELGGAIRILDFKINRQRDSKISNFRLDNAHPNSINIDWDYFDPNYGFAFQIIYIGNGNPEFKIMGKILDVRNFKNVKPTRDTFRNLDIIMFFMVCVTFLSFISGLLIRIRKKRVLLVRDAVVVIVYLGLFTYFVFALFITKDLKPI